MKAIWLFTLSLIFLNCSESESQIKSVRFVENTIVTDSTSTLFIPTRYIEEMLSTNKIALGGDYYANIIVYDLYTTLIRSSLRKTYLLSPCIQMFFQQLYLVLAGEYLEMMCCC